MSVIGISSWQVKIAVKEAKKANTLIVPHSMSAVIWQGKRLISASCNSVRSSYRLNEKIKEMPFIDWSRMIRYKTAMHAEVNACLLADQPLNRASILVLRISKAGYLRLAKPCEWCMNFLSLTGIDDIWYTTDDGFVKTQNQKVRLK
jgi:deoxycytidylate deaminase